MKAPLLSRGPFENGGPTHVVEIWAAVTNTERQEGRGQQIDHSYYATEEEATLGAVGIGVMGGVGGSKSATLCNSRMAQFCFSLSKVLLFLPKGLRSSSLLTSTLIQSRKNGLMERANGRSTNSTLVTSSSLGSRTIEARKASKAQSFEDKNRMVHQAVFRLLF